MQVISYMVSESAFRIDSALKSEIIQIRLGQLVNPILFIQKMLWQAVARTWGQRT